jgi:hypothetical protein
MGEDTALTLAYARSPRITPAESRRYTADQVLGLTLAAYERGRFDAEVNELHATWAEYDEPQLTREQRVAARTAEMKRSADRVAAELGRPAGYRYRGGPVDWQTGMPLGSACAWLRSAPFRQRKRVAA